MVFRLAALQNASKSYLGNQSESRKKFAAGLYHWPNSKKQFTVTVGTIFEDTHVPLRNGCRWYLLCSSKKGISSLQIQRMPLGRKKRNRWAGYRTALLYAPDSNALAQPEFTTTSK